MAKEELTKEELQKQFIEKRDKEDKARKESEIKAGFLNPLGDRTTLDEFLEQVEKSKKSVAEYCKDKLTKEEISALEIEINHYKNK